MCTKKTEWEVQEKTQTKGEEKKNKEKTKQIAPVTERPKKNIKKKEKEKRGGETNKKQTHV